MLQLQQYPSFDQNMMVGRQGSQLERSQEPYRRTHSAYNNTSTTSKTNGTTEPRYQNGRYSSTAQTAPSPSQSSASSASHPATPSDASPAEGDDDDDDKIMPSSTSSPPAEQSRTTPHARPHTSQQPLPTNIPPSSMTSASAPTTAYSSPTRHRRPSSLHDATPQLPPLVRLRDLAQVVDIASQDLTSGSQPSSEGSASAQGEPRYEISQMPVTDIIEMVAALLTKITTTNDRNHDNLQRNMPTGESTSSLPPQTTSVLAFHGKNVPTITIHSYLSRIHKYCPTTYEVFISLLVYFDRMTELVNTGSNKMGKASLTSASSSRSASRTSSSSTPNTEAPPQVDAPAEDSVQNCFVVDSFNIHRLVIAGVTCASKFFSDVFYTNSRYAKVGGLPLVELNHLELQFLLLNDFRLSIPVEELEGYGTMLVQFYAREERAKRRQQAAGE